MDELIKEQLALKETTETFISNYRKDGKDRRTRPYYEKRLKEFEASWLVFKARHHKILVLTRDIANFDASKYDYFNLDVYGEVEEWFFSTYAEIQNRYETEFVPQAQPDTCKIINEPPTNINSMTAPLKLPKIYLEKFYGDYSKWPTFHDLFNCLVHENGSLSPVQKLQYLKLHLSGEPEQLLRHFQVTHNNYSAAWRLLKERYHNTRVLVNAQLKILLGQSAVNTENVLGVKNLLDTTTECLQALNNLNISTSEWDPIIVYITVQKLPSETHQLWEQTISTGRDLPTWQSLKRFLESRFRTLEAVSAKNKTTKDRPLPNAQRSSPRVFHTTTTVSCQNCLGNHSIRQCPTFLVLDLSERLNLVKKRGLCINCLGSGHLLKNCKSQQKCFHCRQPHHTLLHRNVNESGSSNSTSAGMQIQNVSANYSGYSPSETLPHNSEAMSSQFTPNQLVNNPSTTTQPNGFPNVKSFVINNICPGSVFLATAIVKIVSPTGQEQTVRALIDPCSQASFLNQSVAQDLHLKREAVNATIEKVGEDISSETQYIATFEIKPLQGDNRVKVNGFILKSVTGLLPKERVVYQHWEQLQNLQLADPRFHTPGKIDLLLGAEVYGELILHGLLKDQRSGLVAQNTILGWIVTGSASKRGERTISVQNFHICADLDNQLKKFWEIEEVQEEKIFRTEEEQRCEELYVQTTRRLPSGRYEVALPLREESENHYLGRSRKIATTRLNQLYSRLLKDENLKVEYTKCIEEYLTLGHMELVDSSEDFHGRTIKDVEAFSCSYLPHHCVLKGTSSTTKLRVVFDASRSTESGTSLNDMMYKGPVIQDDLITLLIRWRRHRIAFTADIEKMYRQIRIKREHADYQRILWRRSPTQPTLDYKLLTVTFGTKSAPYLATRTLSQLAADEKLQYPVGSRITGTDFYVDDLISGADNLHEAVEARSQLINIMKRGGFSLRKWTSNALEFLKSLPAESCEVNSPIKFDSDESVRTLGIIWNPQVDSLSFYIQLDNSETKWTKRKILSEIAKLFDPLGLVAPIIVLTKIMMQQLWLSGINWDDEIPFNLKREWLTYRASIKAIQNVKINRWIHTTGSSRAMEIHGFADASTKAYAAVLYVCAVDERGKRQVTLLTAKTRVAPLKTISLPRLELCAATLLSKLMNYARKVLKTDIPTSLHAWTDSEIVLSWVRGHPSKWTTFVANRVSHIHELLGENIWKHVPSKQNPADCASRGMLTEELQGHELWWKGPTWLEQTANQWPINHNITDTELEKRKKTASCLNTIVPDELENRYSSLTKLLRVTAYCTRFIAKLKKDSSLPESPHLTADEIQNALKFWVKRTQQTHFKDEIKMLKANQPINKKSRLLKLTPFIDNNGFLRVGGRLQHAELKYEEKHPIILPDKAHITTLIIRKVHIETMHGGPQLMMNVISRTYWLLNSRNTIRMHLHKCITCYKQKATLQTQLMGNLPTPRVTMSRPFAHTGVDYCGPIEVKTHKGRNPKRYKAYVALFVCMATKALHMEVVTDLTSEGFIAAFRRFCARRGLCEEIYCDRGTNFIGASKILSKLQLQMMSQINKEIAASLANKGIKFNFNPPAAPHFGGLWEAGVRSTKFHLKRVIGNVMLTYEELTTVLVQIEACLNSRPLCELSSNPEDLIPLTPAHFLIGDTLLTPPEPSMLNIEINRLNRWQFLQRLYQNFWKRWNTEYLCRLQQRPKWTNKERNVQTGELVLIKEENLPPGKWLMGRIINTHPGPDGLVRVVTIKTKNNQLKRPITKVCLLPITEPKHETN